jgi:hypothetical protein
MTAHPLVPVRAAAGVYYVRDRYCVERFGFGWLWQDTADRHTCGDPRATLTEALDDLAIWLATLEE